MITTTQLSMRYGSKILFKDVNLQLNPGCHYGLVGANGSGKSTFLKVLTGDLTPEKGDISMPSQMTVGTLKQDQFLYEEVPLIHVVMMGKPSLWKALQEKERLLHLPHFTEEACTALENLEKIIERDRGYAAPSEAGKLLEGLGLPSATHTNPMRTLSGGYKLRVLLAQVLFSEPAILLLDEPTNHLDIFSIRWLEDYLQTFPGMLVVSSHDRAFLNKISTHILDVDRETIRIYNGNFDRFEEQKEGYAEQVEATLTKQERKRDDLQTFVDRFGAKATKARQAQSKMRSVKKLEAEMEDLSLKPSCRHPLNLRLPMSRPSGAIALKVNDINKMYGNKQVLKHVSFEIERGDRIAFIGPNGIGKSTLLEILTTGVLADTGGFEWGHAAQLSYFPQDHSKHVTGEHTPLTWLSQYDRKVPEEQIRGVLGTVLFSGDDVHKSVHSLSGGETARLLLARMSLLKGNILIFDEPTNHLDMEATESLLQAMKEYEGSILLVSHNRYFIKEIATRIIEMTALGMRDFRCNYDEYLERCEIDHLSGKKEKSASLHGADDAKLLYEEQKRGRRLKEQLVRKVQQAEDKCHKIELQLFELTKKVGSSEFYQDITQSEQQKIFKEKEKLETALHAALAEWESLATEEL